MAEAPEEAHRGGLELEAAEAPAQLVLVERGEHAARPVRSGTGTRRSTGTSGGGRDAHSR